MSFFFGRKKPDPKPVPRETPVREDPVPAPRPGPPNKRQQYRVQQTPNSVLSATYVSPSGQKYYGECAEVSVGGAGVFFMPDRDPKLVIGSEVEISFQAISRPNSVCIKSRVRSAKPEGAKGTRYGLEFANVADVYAQLDSFYARWFNRREHMRVLPDLAQKVRAKIAWPSGEIETTVHDVSMGGLGLLVLPEHAKLLEGVPILQVSLTLPNEPIVIKATASIRSRNPLSKHTLIGIEFEAKGGIEYFELPLRRYIDRRIESVQQWNAAMQQTRKAR